MGKIVERFSSYINDLTYSERYVLYYAEENLKTAKTLSLTAMAELNNVSTTTIIRMCQKLGLEGFSEFKYILKELETDSGPHQDREGIVDRYQSSLDKALSLLQTKDLEDISEQLMQSKRVFIVAVGLSKMMGEYFSKLLMQVNKSTSYVYESHIIDLLPNMVERGDVVVFISSSGETGTVVKAAEKLRFKNIYTLAITNGNDSTLSKLVQKSISADVTRVTYAGYDLTARSTIVALIDILFEFYLRKFLS
ncbi:MurR/RpiR family transcriptional regulator [Neobacillus muris]|uniref:MurR/RpiR family transcriptional regulator n=1 Tax=Neobacillus muris TaxID=2941334 RepID=UPI00203B1F72|nr:MurR/RpiR family transcriptional regulator [Neobacillus muris]